jgi:hypothetical protein
MGDQSRQLRDVIGALLHTCGLFLVLSGFGPFSWKLAAAGCLSFVLGYLASSRKWVAVDAAFAIFCLRSIFVLIFVSRDVRVILLAAASGLGFYLIFRLVPECTEPFD